MHDLVDGVRAALEDDFVGAYLVGSFALGAADEFSDVDFVVVTERVLGADAVERLQRWALDELSPDWADVVAALRGDRNDRWLRAVEPVDPETVARTLAFADYAEAPCS